MFCRKCGTENEEDNKNCKKCGELLMPIVQQNLRAEETTIPNHFTFAIIATILFFWPTGIPAIICASKVNGFIAEGDLERAKITSKKARNWSILSVIVGLVLIIFIFILIIFSAMNTASL